VARWRLISIDALKNVQLNLSADIKNIPQRIFLDTNVVQYIHDFGEYIFENHTDSNDFFENSRKKKIHKGTFLYNEIEALNIIFSAVERTPFDFAISEKVFHEINSGNNHNLNRYFYDLWDYWQTTIFEYGDEAFTGKGETKAENLISDKSLVGALSKKDFGILHDAIELECDAVLTCDKFRNRQAWIYKKYQIMALYPSDLVTLIKPYQALWF
jgi:hypothetical protein